MRADRNKIIKYAVIFLAVMLFFTIVSNKVSYMMMPEVMVSSSSATPVQLKYEITASGYYEDDRVVFWVNLEKEPYVDGAGRPAAEFSNIKGRLELVIEDKLFNENTQSVGYVCRFDNPPAQTVYDGQNCTVRMEFDLGSYDTVVPRECLFREGARYYVYKLVTVKSVTGESTIVRKQEVTLLEQDDFNAAISASLNFNDRIVLYSSQALRNEQKVRVMK